MTDEDLKEVLSKYQQKAFELFNSNLILETQVNSLQKQILSLKEDLDNLKKVKKGLKPDEDF